MLATAGSGQIFLPDPKARIKCFLICYKFECCFFPHLKKIYNAVCVKVFHKYWLSTGNKNIYFFFCTVLMPLLLFRSLSIFNCVDLDWMRILVIRYLGLKLSKKQAGLRQVAPS